MEDITATLYGISVCRYHDEDAADSFCDLGLVLEDIQEWLGGLASIGESCTYEPSQDDSFLRTFCLDIKPLASDRAVLVVTWNELSSVEDGVQLISAGSAIGEAEVSTVAIDALSVPGYPAFFVLLPQENLLLNLRFEQRLNGMSAFKRFVLGFMQESAKWCVWQQNDKLLGYAEDQQSVTGNFLPEFATSMSRRASNLDWFRREVGNIRKVVHRKLIRPVIESHRTYLDMTFGFLGLEPNRRLRADIDFEYDFKIRLTEDKLQKIFDEYEQTALDDGWTDVGFILARDAQKKHWLSGSICREKISKDIRRTESGTIDIDHLVEILNESLGDIIQRVS
ncbi:hypothetical protein [Rhodanobacter ginsenosidimutans]|uniref:DUF4268 domain-containing protein n=1 Tax=Rhodanobacter ginsenosidimutans TaxID=490571 RepID=A0ABW0K0Q3_9GAMM